MRYGYRIATATSRQVDRASDEYLTTPQTRPTPDLHAELTSLKDTIEMARELGNRTSDVFADDFLA